MSSQYGEHEAILAHFAGRDPSTLRFLDIGAFDGVTFSNTKPLADLGWSGVCVEPSPPAFCHLMNTYEGNPRVELVNAALVPFNDDGPQLLKFHCNTADSHSADMMSTFEVSHRDKWAGHPFREIWTSVITWEHLIGAFGKAGLPFAFVNVDVEGLNAVVVAGMPVRPELLCVELDPSDLVTQTVSNYYRELRIIGGNLLAWGPR